MEPLRLNAIPSRPILQRRANTVGPLASMCSLNFRRGPALARTEAWLYSRRQFLGNAAIAASRVAA